MSTSLCLSYSFVAFHFISHIWEKSYGSQLLISLNMIISRFIHAFANGSMSSILTSFYIVYAYHVFLIQSCIEGHFGCLHASANLNKVAINIGWVNLSRYIFKFGDRHPEEGLLGPMVILFFIFWWTSILFFSGYTDLHSRQSCIQVPFSHNLSNTCCSLSYWPYILIDVCVCGGGVSHCGCALHTPNS